MELNRKPLCVVLAVTSCSCFTFIGLFAATTDMTLGLGGYCCGGLLSMAIVIVLYKRVVRAKMEMGIVVLVFMCLAAGSSALVLFTGEYDFRVRMHCMSMQIWKTTPAIFGFSGTAAASLISWSLCLDIVIWEFVIRYWGHPSELRVHFTSLLYSIGWFGVAWMNAGRLCSIFDAQVALAAEKALMESIISMLCDATVWLSDDGNTIVRADQRLNLILGRNVEGQRVDSILPPCEQERLQGGVSQARAAPVLLPSTLRSSMGRNIKVDMFIVGSRDMNAQGRKDQAPAFLIGLRVGSEGRDELPEIAMDHQHVEKLAERQLEAEQLPEDATSHLTSMPDTTSTDRVFDNLNVQRLTHGMPEEQANGFRSGLEKLTRLGESERWLLRFQDIDISQRELLGAGGFGVVVSARLHGSSVAVKSTRRGADNGRAEHLMAMTNEIRVFRHVRHPNIVIFHGACIEPVRGEIMLVLERVQGSELSEYVTAHSEDAQVFKRYQLLLDVACALRYLHAQSPQIVHGDLKGRNVLVDAAIPRAKLVDFGLSRLITKRVRPLGGTLDWMAPEIISGPNGRPKASADVFSFGRLAYLMIACRKPMQGISRKVIIDMAKSGVTQPLQWSEGMPLHKECREMCQGMLCLDPQGRPSMAQVHIEASSWTLPDMAKHMPTLALVRANEGSEARARVDAADDGNDLRETLNSALAQRPENNRVPRTSGLDGAACSMNSRHASAVPRAAAGSSSEARLEQPVLAVPGKRPTQEAVKRLLAVNATLQWNILISPGRCCKYHAAMAELLSIAGDLNRSGCNHVYAPYHDFQCSSCGVMDVEAPDRCPVCNKSVDRVGSETMGSIREEEEPDGAAAHRSTASSL